MPRPAPPFALSTQRQRLINLSSAKLSTLSLTTVLRSSVPLTLSAISFNNNNSRSISNPKVRPSNNTTTHSRTARLWPFLPPSLSTTMTWMRTERSSSSGRRVNADTGRTRTPSSKCKRLPHRSALATLRTSWGAFRRTVAHRMSPSATLGSTWGKTARCCPRAIRSATGTQPRT